MKDLYSDKFIEALKKHDIDKLRIIPKSDLHNHFVLGGSNMCLEAYLKRYESNRT